MPHSETLILPAYIFLMFCGSIHIMIDKFFIGEMRIIIQLNMCALIPGKEWNLEKFNCKSNCIIFHNSLFFWMFAVFQKSCHQAQYLMCLFVLFQPHKKHFLKSIFWYSSCMHNKAPSLNCSVAYLYQMNAH